MLVKTEVKELLISCGKPHKPATSETVLQMDKISRARVNVSLYKGHVCRQVSVFEQGKRY